MTLFRFYARTGRAHDRRGRRDGIHRRTLSMPFLNLKLAGVPADTAVDHRLQRGLTTLMAEVLG